jgi:uncharacterized protein with HEPN domain
MARDPAYLLDILYSARLIQSFTQGLSYDQFAQDLKTQDAAIRRIAVIDEASKRLSEEFRTSHSTVPWKGMSGMRDVVIHCYDRVKLTQVWEVIQTDIPALIAHIEPLVPPDEPDSAE